MKAIIMKIYVLVENTKKDECFCEEHGLSLYIETSREAILFDSGQSGNFIENAAKEGVDLGKVDIAVLSHGHYDHGGGFPEFLKINDKAVIYINEKAFGKHLGKENNYIGVDPVLKESGRVVITGDEYKIRDGLCLYTCNDKEQIYPAEGNGLYLEENGQVKPDTFRHEQYLLIEDEGKRFLISGCSHKGVLNIVSWFRPDYLIGGFHFKDVVMDEEGQEKLKDAASKLLSYPVMYYTGHCTGTEQYDFLKSIMKDRIEYMYTGRCIQIP